MEKIDWSKAPEGATHWERESYGASAGWMRNDGGEWLFLSSEGRWLKHIISSVSVERLRHMVERPAAWNGEGLPPVGTACEYAGFGEGYKSGFLDEIDVEKVEIIMHLDVRGERAAAFKFFKDDGQCCGVDSGHSHKFRPIRTPEQIAAEEREALAMALYDQITKDCPDLLSSCRKAVAAGWHKQEQPE